jgi:hypothetical protein
MAIEYDHESERDEVAEDLELGEDELDSDEEGDTSSPQEVLEELRVRDRLEKPELVRYNVQELFGNGTLEHHGARN